MKTSLSRVVLALDGPAHAVRHMGVRRTLCGITVPRGANYGERFSGPQCKACARILAPSAKPEVGCSRQ